MSSLGWDLLAILFWPGLITGVLLGWFYMWLVRKLTAQLQGRQGPPFYQPFYDFVKLLGKETIIPEGANRLFKWLPWVSLGSTLFALALIPVPGNPMKAFPGDLILFLYLMEMPAFCEVLAGYTTRSPYAQVSAVREAMMSLGYNLPFLAAVIALAIHAGSFSMAALAATPLSWTHLVVAVAFLLALPARLKSNPFSIPNAEQELAAGVHSEYSGGLLAVFELSHALELVALIGLFAALFVSPILGGLPGVVLYLVLSLVLIILVTVIGSATARVKLNQAFKFYWSWGAGAAVLAILVAMIK